MFDEKQLDGLSFDELGEALDFVRQKIDQIDVESGEHEDPRAGRLVAAADLIISRMDEIVRANPNDYAKHLGVWEKHVREYNESYNRYADTILDDDLLVDFEAPESSPGNSRDASGAELDDLTDEADIRKLDEAGLQERLGVILAEVQRINEEDPDNEDDPRIKRLLAAGQLITNCLDPIYRERYRDDPAALAQWDEIFHSCDDIKEEAADARPSPPGPEP